MSLIYNKTNWKDDKTTPVNAKNLNNIEDGVEYIYHKWDKIIQDSTTGDHAAELIDARYGPNDTEQHPTLGHRLNHMDNKFKEVNSQLEHIKNFNFYKTISKLENGESATIVFLGDSTTEYNNTTNGQLNIVGLVEEYLKSKYGSDKVTVINSGISGQNIHMMWQRVYKDVIKYNPDGIVICSGINDANSSSNKITLEQYQKSYNGLLQEILSSCECDIIIRTPNWCKSNTENSNMLPYNDVVRGLHKKYNLGFIDMFEIMKKDIETGVVTVEQLFDNDEVVHPNENGHKYMFEKFKALLNYSNNPQLPKSNFYSYTYNGLPLPIGGQLVPQEAYFQGGVIVFKQANSYTSFKFIGKSFSLICNGGGSTGQFKLEIDGVDNGIIYDTYCTPSNARMKFDINLSDTKEHTVKIIHLGTKNDNSTGTNIQLQGIIYEKLKVNTNQTDFNFEYGEFVPIVKGSTVEGTNSYTTQLGNYYRIGDRVFFDINIVMSSKDISMDGNVLIGNLPYICKNTFGNANPSCTIGLIGRLTYNSVKEITACVHKSTDYIGLYKASDAISETSVKATDISDIFRIYVSGSYDIA